METSVPPDLADHLRATAADPKAAEILLAAFDTFVSFGHRRTSMQDIADGAGISRAAIYLHFRNKDDIFAAMLSASFSVAAKAVADALAQSGDPSRILGAAFDAQLAGGQRQLMESPHFEAMMSVTKPAPAQAIADGRAEMIALYSRWLERGVNAGQIDPSAVAGSAERMARVMLAGLDGMRFGGFDWTQYADARKHLARIYARAIRP